MRWPLLPALSPVDTDQTEPEHNLHRTQAKTRGRHRQQDHQESTTPVAALLRLSFDAVS